MANFLQPKKIIETIDIRPGFKVADFGAGSGFYSIAASRAVGDTGIIYAIDIRKSSLEAVRSHAKIERLYNIETIWSDLEQPNGSKLKNDSCDAAITANILFQVQNRLPLIQEMFRILKKGSKAILIEWDSTASSLPMPSFTTPEQLQKEFENAGFRFDRKFDAGTHHYGLIFIK